MAQGIKNWDSPSSDIALVFYNIPFDHGGGFDTTNGIYTVPISGMYLFIVTISLYSPNETRTTMMPVRSTTSENSTTTEISSLPLRLRSVLLKAEETSIPNPSLANDNRTHSEHLTTATKSLMMHTTTQDYYSKFAYHNSVSSTSISTKSTNTQEYERTYEYQNGVSSTSTTMKGYESTLQDNLSSASFSIMVDNTSLSYGYSLGRDELYDYATAHCVYQLTQGQTVWIRSHGKTYSNSFENHFTGVLITPDL